MEERVGGSPLQYQIFAEVLDSLVAMFGRLPAARRARAEDLILRILPGMGDHVLTADLDRALAALVSTLERAGRQLARSVGKLGSRATRGSQG